MRVRLPATNTTPAAIKRRASPRLTAGTSAAMARSRRSPATTSLTTTVVRPSLSELGFAGVMASSFSRSWARGAKNYRMSASRSRGTFARWKRRRRSDPPADVSPGADCCCFWSPRRWSLSIAGCESHGHGEEEGEPSGATCPATQTLTYANFGMAFFQQYCQRCHGSTVTGAARNGAPVDHVFDTVADIKTMREHIDRKAAAGPTVVNETMPPSGTAPSDAERRQLGEWLACGAPP